MKITCEAETVEDFTRLRKAADILNTRVQNEQGITAKGSLVGDMMRFEFDSWYPTLVGIKHIRIHKDEIVVEFLDCSETFLLVTKG